MMTITYECPCGTTWTGDWFCACDDDCPDCGASVEASTWTEAQAEPATRSLLEDPDRPEVYP